MLSLSPPEFPEFPAELELVMTMDLAQLYAAHLYDTQQAFLESAAETLLEQNGIDPLSDLGRDLTQDLCNKIDFQVTVK